MKLVLPIFALLLLVATSSRSDAGNNQIIPKAVQVQLRLFHLPAKGQKEQKKERMAEFDSTLRNVKPFEFLGGGEFFDAESQQYQPIGLKLEGQVAGKDQQLLADLKVTLTRQIFDRQWAEGSVKHVEVFEFKSQMQPGVQKVIWLKTGQGRPRWLEVTITPRTDEIGT